MRFNSRNILAALLALSSPVVAQDASHCTPTQRTPAPGTRGAIMLLHDGKFQSDEHVVSRPPSEWGPGEGFGVTGLDCPSCRIERGGGHPAVYTFFAEPVITHITGASPFMIGDVIEAVNDQPITSSAGAEAFTRPAPGQNTVTVRRGRDRVVLKFTLAVGSTPCATAGAVVRSTTGVIGAGHEETIQEQPTAPTSRYGFAVSCTWACTLTSTPDGAPRYKFLALPKIAAIRDTSLARVTGLKIGDVIVKIDGRSILDDDAALPLFRLDRKEPLRMTVQRDGKLIDYVLQATPHP